MDAAAATRRAATANKHRTMDAAPVTMDAAANMDGFINSGTVNMDGAIENSTNIHGSIAPAAANIMDAAIRGSMVAAAATSCQISFHEATYASYV